MGYGLERTSFYPHKYATRHLNEPYYISAETMQYIKSQRDGAKFKRHLDSKVESDLL